MSGVNYFPSDHFRALIKGLCQAIVNFTSDLNSDGMSLDLPCATKEKTNKKEEQVQRSYFIYIAKDSNRYSCKSGKINMTLLEILVRSGSNWPECPEIVCTSLPPM